MISLILRMKCEPNTKQSWQHGGKKIFGAEVIKGLSDRHRAFLGIQITDNLMPTEDLEVTC